MKSNYKETIKVLVVDDSAFMRKVLTDILNSADGIGVIDTAKNGFEAIGKANELKPDVIALDINMPVMNGLECLKKLNETSKVPVIMLSSDTKEGVESTIQALADGAIDFIAKPSNIFDMTSVEKQKEVIEKVRMAVSTTENKSTCQIKKIYDKNRDNDFVNIVAIGTSTGGPKALQNVIPQIPENIKAAFLVVQHMPPGFTKSLAERLDAISNVKVKEAEDGETIKCGQVYVAAGDYHMKVEKGLAGVLEIKLTKDPPISGLRPSVDVMMESLSQSDVKNVVGVIMTGMGGDGSKGITKLKYSKNAYIIAQDESSCVVYGMPRVAVQTGVVDVVVPLEGIADEIIRIVGVHK